MTDDDLISQIKIEALHRAAAKGIRYIEAELELAKEYLGQIQYPTKGFQAYVQELDRDYLEFSIKNNL